MIQANEVRVGNRFIRELNRTRGLEYDHDFVLTEEWIGKLFSSNTSIALNDLYPIPITEDILLNCGFKNNKDYRFESYPLHPYWIKDGVVLFYNIGQEEYSYLLGYAEIRMGKYYAVGIRWINHLHDLQNAYKIFKKEELEVNI